MVFQELLGVVAALAQAHLAVVEPCAALLDDTQLDAKVKNFSFANIDTISTSSLVTRLTTDVTNVQNAFMMIIRIAVRAPLMLVFAVVMAVYVGKKLSLVFVLVIPILAAGLFAIIHKAMPLYRSVFRKYDAMNESIQENVKGMRVVKSFVREDVEKEKFAGRNEKLKSMAEKAFGFVVMFMPLIFLLMGGTIVAVLWIGGNYVYEGSLLSGDLIAFFTYVSEILMSLMMVSMVMMMLTRSIACGRRVMEVLNEEPQITDEKAREALTVEDGSIRFDHVYFRYNPNGQTWNLEDIDLHIPSGATVGILGGTGSAKTTLVSLIPRLYEATEGSVRVGGHDVREYSMKQLRDACAMVLQKNTLFSGTIKENLRWGDAGATEEEMREACRIACAEEFMEKMPDGYDTYTEQGGTNGSGGQKQQACIARAILRRPKVLILDDSTSAVDTATDAAIRQGLRSTLPGTTKVIIAQRISSVQDADIIVVLDDGKISGVGTHTELLKTNEIYREVYESQQGGGAIDG